jgi:predicted secreted protein
VQWDNPPVEGTPDTNEVREVEAGAQFYVVLPAPGGSGYRWEVAALTEGMTLIAEHPRAAVTTPGATVAQRFLLRAGTVSGAAIFQLRRSWEAAPVRRHGVEVRIRT